MPSKALQKLYRNLPVVKELRHILAETRYLHTLHEREQHVYAANFELQLLAQGRYQSPKRLSHYEQQVFSQGGEDGILTEIFRRVDPVSRTFLEIGVQDGRETLTTFWLTQGWSGGWIEGDLDAVRRAQMHFKRPISEGRLKIAHAFVTAENVESLISQFTLPAELDLLSLDIDRNTYWLWQAISSLRPRVVVVEYNGEIPAPVDWKVEYQAERTWNGTNYFGASLKAYELLGRDKGYSLVGCNLSGVNAFFVRTDLCGEHFEAPFTAENHFEPFRHFLVRHPIRPRSFDENDALGEG